MGAPQDRGIGVHAGSTGNMARARVMAKAPTTPCHRCSQSICIFGLGVPTNGCREEVCFRNHLLQLRIGILCKML
jgi:hypothetical protein